MSAAGMNNDSARNEIDRDHKLRTAAMELAVQLPGDQIEALKVLDYVRTLVVDFLPGHPPPEPPKMRVVV